MDFRVVHHVPQSDIDEIHAKLKEFNLAHREHCENIPLGIFLEDAQGEMQAGLTGEIFGLWLEIHYLWVTEPLRGQGIGSRLLRRAEQEAVAKGAKYAFVDTFDFQAPDFYTQYGYQQVFQLFDYPYTGARYYYVKELMKGSV